MRTLRYALGAAVLGVVTTLVIPPAAHASGETMDGGCFLIAVNGRGLTNFTMAGVIGDLSVTRDSTGPTSATVTCWVVINGNEASGSRHSYSGTAVQAGADHVGFSLVGSSDRISLCQQVTYMSGATAQSCRQLDGLVSASSSALQTLVCPLLVALGVATGGGVAGVAEIGPDGDLYTVDRSGLLGPTLLFDCPPYATDLPWNAVIGLPPPLPGGAI